MRRRRRIEVCGVRSESADDTRNAIAMILVLRARMIAGVLFDDPLQRTLRLEHSITVVGHAMGVRQGAWS
jgi:hypothetical protein